MRINKSNANSASGFYATGFEVFAAVLNDSEIAQSFEMGGGVAIHYGTYQGAPIWLLDNPGGNLYGIWVEENEPQDR